MLLLEAGPDPDPIPPEVADGTQWPGSLMTTPYITRYPARRHADGGMHDLLAGRIMGGGSSINAAAAVRPAKSDLDGWAELGNHGWSYEDCLPVLERIEARGGGPLHIERADLPEHGAPGLVAALVDSAAAAGLPRCRDESVAEPLGIVPAAFNVKDGVRQSTNVAYLGPARPRPNLDVLAGAAAHSLAVDGSRVSGVRYEHGGEVGTVDAGRVVLSAGVFRSPQILMLSGIGPAADLQRLGIDVVHPLPGVGRNFQDHPTVILMYEATADPRLEGPVSGVIRLVFPGDPSSSAADIHVYLRPTFAESGRRLLPVAVSLVEHRSRGRVYLKSADPDQLPGIDDALLTHPDDVAALTRGLQAVHEIVSSDAVSGYVGSLVSPAPGEGFTRHAVSTFESFFHGVGTCKMGPESDPESVVDPSLRVHGIENLYVADASIMPTIPHANTNLAAIMIGERVGDLIGRTSH